MLPVDIYPCCRITILASLLLQYFRSHSTLACLSMRSVGYRSGLVRLVGKARLLQTTIWLWWRSQTWVILLTLPNVTSSLHIGHALTIAIQVYKIQWFDEIVWLGRPPSRCLDLIYFNTVRRWKAIVQEQWQDSLWIRARTLLGDCSGLEEWVCTLKMHSIMQSYNFARY